MLASLTLCLLAAGQFPPQPAELAPRLDSAVETAAREYRIATYNRFRLDREQYEERQQLGWELLARFRRLEDPQAHRSAVLEWFRQAGGWEGEEALAAVLPLPTLPESPEQLVERPAAEAKPAGENGSSTKRTEKLELQISLPALQAPAVNAPGESELNGLGGSLLRAVTRGFTAEE